MKIALLCRTTIGLEADYPYDHEGRDATDNIDAVERAKELVRNHIKTETSCGKNTPYSLISRL